MDMKDINESNLKEEVEKNEGKDTVEVKELDSIIKITFLNTGHIYVIDGSGNTIDSSVNFSVSNKYDSENNLIGLFVNLDDVDRNKFENTDEYGNKLYEKAMAVLATKKVEEKEELLLQYVNFSEMFEGGTSEPPFKSIEELLQSGNPPYNSVQEVADAEGMEIDAFLTSILSEIFSSVAFIENPNGTIDEFFMRERISCRRLFNV